MHEVQESDRCRRGNILDGANSRMCELRREASACAAPGSSVDFSYVLTICSRGLSGVVRHILATGTGTFRSGVPWRGPHNTAMPSGRFQPSGRRVRLGCIQPSCLRSNDWLFGKMNRLTNHTSGPATPAAVFSR